MRTLRELRLWHWRQAMSWRKNANGRNVAHHIADRHIKAVQLLNDVVSGTAEDDDETICKKFKWLSAPTSEPLEKEYECIFNSKDLPKQNG